MTHAFSTKTYHLKVYVRSPKRGKLVRSHMNVVLKSQGIFVSKNSIFGQEW